MCETERSCTSLVDKVDVCCRHCETGGLMSVAEVSRFAGASSSTAVSQAASRSPTSSTRGELSASAERSVRLPGARPTVGTSDVAAPRARLIDVRARRPVIRSYTPGEKIQKRGPSPCPNVHGLRLYILCLHSLYSGVVGQSNKSPRGTCCL